MFHSTNLNQKNKGILINVSWMVSSKMGEIRSISLTTIIIGTGFTIAKAARTAIDEDRTAKAQLTTPLLGSTMSEDPPRRLEIFGSWSVSKLQTVTVELKNCFSKSKSLSESPKARGKYLDVSTP